MFSRLLVLSLILALPSGFLLYASRPEQIPDLQDLGNIPLKLQEWQGRDDPPMEPQILEVLGVDDYISRYYVSGAGSVGLYVGYYKSQKQGDAIHSPLNCLPGAGWNPASKVTIQIPVIDGLSGQTSSVTANRIVIEKGMDKQLVVYWYQSHGRTIASEYKAKIYSVLDAVRTNRTDAALVRVISPIGSSAGRIETESSAESRAVEFVKVLFPILQRLLPS
jgi:EpsI family protein